MSIRIGDQELTEFSIKTTANTMPVSSSFPTVDPSWRMMDPQGHEHFYDSGYPTLDYIIDRQHWCAGDEGLEPHDPHWAIDESHYECSQCRETITPGLRPPGWTETIPTTREITVTVTGLVDFVEAEGFGDDRPGTFVPIKRELGERIVTEFAFVPLVETSRENTT